MNIISPNMSQNMLLPKRYYQNCQAEKPGYIQN